MAFQLAITTGMRQGEILVLRWADINFDSKVLKTKQTLAHNGKQILTGAKTKASLRTIRLTEKDLTLLKKHKAQIAKE